MKKILNDAFAYAEETLRGLVRAYPQYYRLVDGQKRVVARTDGPVCFSGEALYHGRDMGTVEAALASGAETARAILAAAGKTG